MTASLPELPDTSSSETEGAAASVEPDAAAASAAQPAEPRAPRAPRATAKRPAPRKTAAKPAPSADSDSAPASSSSTDAATPDASAPTNAAKPKAAATPRAPRAATPRAAGAAGTASSAKKPATPRAASGAGAAKKPTTPRAAAGTAKPRTASATGAAKKPTTPRATAKKPAAPRGAAASAAPETDASQAPTADDAGTVEMKTAAQKVAVPSDVVTQPSPTAGPVSPVLELDDIVVPPRPPLPATAPVAPASAAAPVESSSTDDIVEDAPAAIDSTPVIDSTPAADPTPADVAVEEPVVEVPAVEMPVAEEPVAEEPVAEDAPVAADPTPADVAVEGPVVEEPVVEEPVVEEPVVEDAPVAADPTPTDAAVEEPVVEEPVVEPTDADENPEAVQATDPEEPSTGAEAVATTPVDPTPPDVRVDELDSDVAPDERGVEPAVDTDAVAPATDAEPTPATATAVLAQPALEVEAVASVSPGSEDETAVPALALRHVTKNFGELRAVDAIDLTVPAGSFYGLVGPNGAGKTTTLSIIAGLLRADAGTVTINGVDAKKRAREAKKLIGVLPDRLRTFDRLTGRQLLSYYGALRGLPSGLVESRMADLARAFDLVDALARPVSDYSAGMTKKVMLAGAMIHSPRLLVLDEPFEAVDPVSSGVILDILGAYVDHGGTVILSSHGMELVERVCSRVAVIVSGQVLAEGTVDEVRGEGTLEQRFRELSGGLGDVEGLEWLHTFSA